MHFVVTGANRGIGLELTRQLIERGNSVDATAREPDTANDLNALAAGSHGTLRVFRCDVGSDSSVIAFARAIESTPIDVIINNAGVYGTDQSLERLDTAGALHTLDVNALGPLRVSRALLPMLRRGQRKSLVHITSGMGSIGDNTSGGSYGYRMSKAALNMASKSMSIDLAHERISSVVVNPGWVKTDMGGAGATLPVETSARNILKLIDRLRFEDSGAFFDHTGDRIEW
jgi:NAD(P)-dependent dehydrogenase (short-subunit alcohol dehydrogenase family)